MTQMPVNETAEFQKFQLIWKAIQLTGVDNVSMNQENQPLL